MEKCEECFKMIKGTAVKAGGLAYHPECFICHTCKIPIQGSFATGPDGKTRTCAKCISDQAPKCAGCGKAIEGPTLEIDKEKYHPGCLKCAKCKGELTAGVCKGHDGRPICPDCAGKGLPSALNALVADPCTRCGKGLEGEVVDVGGKKYHASCFNCTDCGSGFPDNKFFNNPKESGSMLCPSCADKLRSSPAAAAGSTSKCAKCHLPAEGSMVGAEGKMYHEKCFVCPDCNVSLAGGFSKITQPDGTCDGTLYCGGCAQKRAQTITTGPAKPKCKKCEKDIDGPAVKAEKGDMFHEECFKCDECKVALTTYVVDSTRRFKFQTATYLCEPCGLKVKAAAQPHDSLKCQKCGEDCDADNGSIKLMNGYGMHWACFKCCECGNTQEPTDDPLFKKGINSHVARVMKDAWYCKPCIADGKMKEEAIVEIEPAPQPQKKEAPAELPPITFTLSLKELQDAGVCHAKGVYPARKEEYLTDAEFESVFKMDKVKFAAQPGWKKENLKKAQKIF